MRTPLLATAVLIMQLVVSSSASACSGPVSSISQVVESSSHIFTAKVGKRISDSEDGGVIELLVVEVVKGPSPGVPSVHANQLYSPLEQCGAIMTRTPLPLVETGSEWLISGSFGFSGQFMPTSGGSFRLASSQQRLKDEDRKRLLLEFRRVIQLKSKQPTRAAP